MVLGHRGTSCIFGSFFIGGNIVEECEILSDLSVEKDSWKLFSNYKLLVVAFSFLSGVNGGIQYNILIDLKGLRMTIKNDRFF